MPSKVFAIEAKLERERTLRELTTRIHALPIDDLLLRIKDDVARLLECERVTIFALDARRNELYSRVKDGEEIREIRLPVGAGSFAGFVAFKRKGLNIQDAYDAREIGQLDAALRFDDAWDKKTHFKTRQVLAVPIMKDRTLHGVIEAMNAKKSGAFNDQHQSVIAELAETLGVAFGNQERLNIRSSPHDHLLRSKLVTSEQLDQAAAAAQQEGRSVEHILAGRYRIPKAEIARSLSEYHRTEFVFFSPELEAPKDLLQGFTMDYLKHHLVVPLRREDGKVVVVMTNPRALTLCDDISKRLGGVRLVTRVSTREDVVELIDHFYGEHRDVPKRALNDLVQEIRDQRAAEGIAPEEEKEQADAEGMVALVNGIIEEAAEKGASDIHVEPGLDGDLVVRHRVDGLCRIAGSFPRDFSRNIVARIKIMAGLDIAEHRLPQDGKIRFRDYGTKDIELRVATIPTTGGNEDVVMRILAASKPRPIADLAMAPENLERFRKVIEEPYGIILCVGPTGSGKTTTLHSALGHLNKADVKIWTAEDPVEITQAGLRQVQVQPKIGFTFERALRSFLRLDPDIIMIGEMRDLETAGAAIEASLTGHLVLSTLHTNNAPETVTRMLDLGLDPFTFGDALLAILAQRLVRTLCSSCRQSAPPTDAEWATLRQDFGDDALFDALVKREGSQIGRPKGCERCGSTGYRGRMAIHELLTVDDDIRHMIYRKAISADIRAAAMKKGMIMLKQDGVRKILQGKTDINEVRSVCMK